MAAPAPATSDRWALVRTTLVGLAAFACVVLSLSYVLPRIVLWDLTPDFTMLWAAGRFALERPGDIYDAAELTLAQAEHHRRAAPLPFIYPPSALALVIPFGLLPFWAAFWTWSALSAAAFWTAARRLAGGWAIPLAFASPHVVLVLLLGQTTLLVGSALIWGLSLLKTRPLLAGILIGVAAAVKPHSVFLAPVAFLSGRHWQAFAGAAIGGMAMIASSLPFGPALWLDWASALRGFDEVLAGHGVFERGATPAMAAAALGLHGPGLWLGQAAATAAGVAIVWRGFRCDDLHTRLLCFVCGSLLASPYAMRYELAVLAPVFASALLSGSVRGFAIASPLFALNVFTILPALLVSAGARLLELPRARAAGRQPRGRG